MALLTHRLDCLIHSRCVCISHFNCTCISSYLASRTLLWHPLAPFGTLCIPSALPNPLPQCSYPHVAPRPSWSPNVPSLETYICLSWQRVLTLSTFFAQRFFPFFTSLSFFSFSSTPAFVSVRRRSSFHPLAGRTPYSASRPLSPTLFQSIHTTLSLCSTCVPLLSSLSSPS